MFPGGSGDQAFKNMLLIKKTSPTKKFQKRYPNQKIWATTQEYRKHARHRRHDPSVHQNSMTGLKDMERADEGVSDSGTNDQWSERGYKLAEEFNPGPREESQNNEWVSNMRYIKSCLKKKNTLISCSGFVPYCHRDCLLVTGMTNNAGEGSSSIIQPPLAVLLVSLYLSGFSSLKAWIQCH